ncbi:MAG: regulatory protein RecX [Armatimonadetes bacterium]|jgi:regulatory protein|nr:regulatory protein RecX [Armatimonadota bacterium]
MTHPECSTITAIEPQVRNRDRFNVFVDGEWVVGVHAEVVVAAGLRVGQAMTAEVLQSLVRAEELRHVRESAFRLLGYRARSQVELRRRLLQKGYDPGMVEEVLAALGRSGLINDAEFSQSWVRARTGSRPMGPNRIAAELRQKGVDREVIDEALEAVDTDAEMALALTVGRRKIEQLRGEDPRVARRKLGSVLMRRGFSSGVCARVLDLLLREDD